MKTVAIFLVLWIVLLASLGSDMAYSYSQYRLAKKLDALVEHESRSNRAGGDGETAEELQQRTEQLLEATTSAGFDLLLSAGLGFVFFVNRKQLLRQAAGEKGLARGRQESK